MAPITKWAAGFIAGFVMLGILRDSHVWWIKGVIMLAMLVCFMMVAAILVEVATNFAIRSISRKWRDAHKDDWS